MCLVIKKQLSDTEANWLAAHSMYPHNKQQREHFFLISLLLAAAAVPAAGLPFT